MMRELGPVLGVLALLAATVHGYMAPAGLEGGDCAKPTVQNSFDIQKFQGVWREAQTVPNMFTLTKKCTKMEYYWDGNVVKATTTGRDEDDQPTTESTEMTWKLEAARLAHFVVKVKEMPDLEVPFQILSTDYNNYACVYSCSKYQDFKLEFSWALARDISQAKDASRACRRIFANNNIDISKIINTYQGAQCDAPPPPRLRNGGLPSFINYNKGSRDNSNTKIREQQSNNNFGKNNNSNNRRPNQSNRKPYTPPITQQNDNKVKVNTWKPYQGYQRSNQPKDKNVPKPYQGYQRPNQPQDLNVPKPYQGYQRTNQPKDKDVPKPYQGYQRTNMPKDKELPKPYQGYERTNLPKDKDVPKPYQGYQRTNLPKDKDVPKPYQGYQRTNLPKDKDVPKPYQGYQRTNLPKDKDVPKPYQGYQRTNLPKDKDVQIKTQIQTPYKPYQSVEEKNFWKKTRNSQDKDNVNIKQPNKYEKDNKNSNWSSNRGKSLWGIRKNPDASQKDYGIDTTTTATTTQKPTTKHWAVKDFHEKTIYHTKVEADGRQIYKRYPYRTPRTQAWSPWRKSFDNSTTVKSFQKDEARPIFKQRKTLKNSNTYAVGVISSECADKEKSCEYWASLRECERNPSWMNENCRKSCKKCGTTSWETMSTKNKSASSCVDKDAGCQGWASRRECKKNRKWMNENCPRACGKCS